MKLIDWPTPFAHVELPSVVVIPNLDAVDMLDVVVAPHGLDRYPKYLIKFQCVPAYRCLGESTVPDQYLLHADNPHRSSYIWEGSPWLAEFEDSRDNIEASFMVPFSDVKHYVVFGGDSIVEILAAKEPLIEEIPSAKVIRTCGADQQCTLGC